MTLVVAKGGEAGDEGEYASSSSSLVSSIRRKLNIKNKIAVIGDGCQKKVTQYHHWQRECGTNCCRSHLSAEMK